MKHKRIGIDARLYFQTGVGTYVRNLLEYLPTYIDEQIEVFVYVLSGDVAKIKLNDPRFVVRPVSAHWHSLSEQTIFYHVLMQDRLDLMHFTYFSYPVLYTRPFVATVHDLTPLFFKTGRASQLHPMLYEIKHRTFRFILGRQIDLALRIISPTHSVKAQIAQVYGKFAAEKTQVITEGVNYELMDVVREPKPALAPHLPSSYFLYVGNFYPHKNVERLILAYRALAQAGKPALVLVGPDNFMARHMREIVDTYQMPDIHFIHAASHEELAALYMHARALINPSLSEGFGLPLVEAAYFGCPVIASDIPAFKELLGESYISFDPTSIEEMTSKLATDPKKLPPAALDQSFSFESMARELAELYAEQLLFLHSHGKHN